MANKRVPKDSVIAILIFLAVFIIQNYTGFEPVTDSRWSVPTALSMIRQGNIDLDEYGSLLKRNKYYMIEIHDDHEYSTYPLGASIMALPVVFLADHQMNPLLRIQSNPGPAGLQTKPDSTVLDLDSAFIQPVLSGIEAETAAIIIALTAVFIFLIGREYLDSENSLLLSFIFAFCTSAWSTGSRSLMQHGPSMLMLTVALYLLIKAGKNPRLAQFAALPLAFSFVIRPTNAIPILFLTIYVFIKFRSYFLRYAAWAAIVSVPFFLYNQYVFGYPLSKYYGTKGLPFDSRYLEALVGNLVSPGRGLFVFTPVFLFCILGVYLKYRQKSLGLLDYSLLGIIFTHWLFISFLTPDWWGGYSFGNRFFSDLVPLFVFFLIPVFQFIPKIAGWKQIATIATFVLLVFASFFIHFQGAYSENAFLWNAKPADIDTNPSRLWDWSDLQFLRGL